LAWKIREIWKGVRRRREEIKKEERRSRKKRDEGRGRVLIEEPLTDLSAK